MYRIIVTVIIILINSNVALAASPEEIMDAFKKNQLVQAEIQKQKASVVGEQEEIQVVDLGGSCGVVGCYFYSLVVMRITRGGTNPQTSTVLAKVSGLNGKIGEVELVDLVPKMISTSR